MLDELVPLEVTVGDVVEVGPPPEKSAWYPTPAITRARITAIATTAPRFTLTKGGPLALSLGCQPALSKCLGITLMS